MNFDTPRKTCVGPFTFIIVTTLLPVASGLVPVVVEVTNGLAVIRDASIGIRCKHRYY